MVLAEDVVVAVDVVAVVLLIDAALDVVAVAIKVIIVDVLVEVGNGTRRVC